MKLIITKQNPNGSFDEVGMNNRRLYSQYKSMHSAVRYANTDWAGKEAVLRLEFFADEGFTGGNQPFNTVFVEKNGKKLTRLL